MIAAKVQGFRKLGGCVDRRLGKFTNLLSIQVEVYSDPLSEIPVAWQALYIIFYYSFCISPLNGVLSPPDGERHWL